MIGCSPFYAMHGREAKLPIDLIYGSKFRRDAPSNVHSASTIINMETVFRMCRNNLKMTIMRARSNYTGRLEKEPLLQDDLVWLFTPTKKDKQGIRGAKYGLYWTGPWLVIRKISDVLFTIKSHGNWNRKEVTTVVSIDRVKRYRENDLSSPDSCLSPGDVQVEDEFIEWEHGAVDEEEAEEWSRLNPEVIRDHDQKVTYAPALTQAYDQVLKRPDQHPGVDLTSGADAAAFAALSTEAESRPPNYETDHHLDFDPQDSNYREPPPPPVLPMPTSHPLPVTTPQPLHFKQVLDERVEVAEDPNYRPQGIPVKTRYVPEPSARVLRSTTHTQKRGRESHNTTFDEEIDTQPKGISKRITRRAKDYLWPPGDPNYPGDQMEED